MAIILSGKVATGVSTPPVDGRTLFANASDNGKLYVKLPSGATVAIEGSGGCGGPCGSNSFECGTGAPSTPGTSSCDMYVDSSTGDIYIWDGATNQWRQSGGGGASNSVGTGAPSGAGTIVGELYIDDATGDIYTWDGTNWLKNEATGGGGTFTCADVANCINSNASTITALTDFVENTHFTDIETDNLVVHTSSTFTGTNTYNNVTENYTGGTSNYDSTHVTNDNGTTNYSSTSVENHNGDTINNNNNTINNTSTFTALGCSSASATPVDESINASATKVDVAIVYDNTTNVAGDTRSKTVTVTEQSGLVTVNDVANGHSGELTVERNTGTTNIEVRQTSGAGTSTADVCQFSGGVIINDNGSITNNENTIVNNDNTTNNNTNVNEYYDEDSSVTNMGNTYNENLIANNIVIENGGSIVVNGSWIKQSENTVGATEIVLSGTPMSGEAGLLVFKQDSGIHRTEPDYTYDAVNNKITFTALVAGEVVEIRYMKGTGASIGVGYSTRTAITAGVEYQVGDKGGLVVVWAHESNTGQAGNIILDVGTTSGSLSTIDSFSLHGVGQRGSMSSPILPNEFFEITAVHIDQARLYE